MVKPILTAMMVAAMGSSLMAQEIDQSEQVEAGRDLFMRHCATCHGLEANGQGPMAPILLIQPKDLTRLSGENGGDFPMTKVIQRIDGRDPLVSHGSAMPVYGEFFEGNDTALKTASGQPIMTSRAIADLVAYLLTLQEKSN